VKKESAVVSNKTILAWISLGLFAASALAKMYASFAQSVDLNYASTAALIPFLALFYVLSARRTNALLLLALLFSLLGDLLMLSSSVKNLLALGIGGFFLSHVFFILALVRPVSHFRAVKLWQYSLVVPYVAYGILVYLLLAPYLGDLRIPAVIYMAAVLLRSYAALTRVGSFGGRSYWLPLIGSVIFILSDTIIAFNVFVYGGQMKNGDFYGALTYIPAQLLLVLGFLP
jgi:uncharacterized membrane protein YhhN